MAITARASDEGGPERESISGIPVDHEKVATAKEWAIRVVDADDLETGHQMARAIMDSLTADEQIELQLLLKAIPCGKKTYYSILREHYYHKEGQLENWR